MMFKIYENDTLLKLRAQHLKALSSKESTKQEHEWSSFMVRSLESELSERGVKF